MRTYLTLPRLAGNPRVPWLDRLRSPHRTGWVHLPCDPFLGHHDDHRDALLPWLVLHCHWQPEWFPGYRLPYKLGGHCLKQTLLMLKGKFDADNGGYWKQNISSWACTWKMLWIIEGWSMNVIRWFQTVFVTRLYTYLLFPMATDGNLQDLWQHWWHNLRYIYITVKHSSHITAEINHPELWRKIDAEIMGLHETVWILSRSFFQSLTPNSLSPKDMACMSILSQSTDSDSDKVFYTKLRAHESGWKKPLYIAGTSFNIQLCYLHSTQWNGGAVALTKMNLTQLTSQTRLMEIFGLTRDIHQHSDLLLPQH